MNIAIEICICYNMPRQNEAMSMRTQSENPESGDSSGFRLG